MFKSTVDDKLSCTFIIQFNSSLTHLVFAKLKVNKMLTKSQISFSIFRLDTHNLNRATLLHDATVELSSKKRETICDKTIFISALFEIRQDYKFASCWLLSLILNEKYMCALDQQVVDGNNSHKSEVTH